MNTITELKMQKRNKNRVNLYLDGKYFCALDLETTVKNQLKVGTIISEQKLEEIQTQSEKQSAYLKVLKLISTRYKTQKEVERYLYDNGYLSQTVYYCISKLMEYHYIDDERYVESYISAHKSSNGRLKIKQELMQKGVAESIIDNALASEGFVQDDEILALAEKYMKNKDDTKENYVKLFRHLMSKGFQYDEIKNALKKEIEWWKLALILLRFLELKKWAI